LNFSFFTLPSGIISIVAVVFLSLSFLYDLVIFLIKKISQYATVGFNLHSNIDFNWFYINTQTVFFVTIILYVLLIFSIVIGTQMNKQGKGFDWHIIPYLLIYTVVAPFWLLKAVWNTIAGRRQPAWR
jgi:hypothetical protein